MDRGTWWSTVNGVTKDLDTTEQLTKQQDYILHQQNYYNLLKAQIMGGTL